MVSVLSIFRKKIVDGNGAIKRAYYSPIPSIQDVPVFEKYESHGYKGPDWAEHCILVNGTHFPNCLAKCVTTGRWALHVKREEVYHPRTRRRQLFGSQTIFWFESDEDYFAFKLAGAFGDVVKYTNITKLRKQRAQQSRDYLVELRKHLRQSREPIQIRLWIGQAGEPRPA